MLPFLPPAFIPGFTTWFYPLFYPLNSPYNFTQLFCPFILSLDFVLLVPTDIALFSPPFSTHIHPMNLLHFITLFCFPVLTFTHDFTLRHWQSSYHEGNQYLFESKWMISDHPKKEASHIFHF